MLILVRKVQQGIWIQGDILVQVLSVDRDRVKLGITAPSDVKVMRQELFAEVPNPGVKDDDPPPSGAPAHDAPPHGAPPNGNPSPARKAS